MMVFYTREEREREREERERGERERERERRERGERERRGRDRGAPHLDPDKELGVLVRGPTCPGITNGTVLPHTQVLACVFSALKRDIVVREGTHDQVAVLVVFALRV